MVNLVSPYLLIPIATSSRVVKAKSSRSVVRKNVLLTAILSNASIIPRAYSSYETRGVDYIVSTTDLARYTEYIRLSRSKYNFDSLSFV